MASRKLHRYLGVLALFALGNSSDAFLLLRAQEAGVAVAFIPLLWTFHHLVKAGSALSADDSRTGSGRRRAIVLGLGGLRRRLRRLRRRRQRPSRWSSLFALYGLFHALTEGPERAFVADLAPAAARGRAFGLYHAVTGDRWCCPGTC